MSVTYTIITTAMDDYDGVISTAKNVSVDINGVTIKEYYSYGITTTSASIVSEVSADLVTKGYST